eukprot:1752430-Rhodomonas_salina.1
MLHLHPNSSTREARSAAAQTLLGGTGPSTSSRHTEELESLSVKTNFSPSHLTGQPGSTIYFLCPSPKSQHSDRDRKTTGSTRPPGRVVPGTSPPSLLPSLA